MTKNIAAGLQAELDATVTSLAMCIEIVRSDGRTFRMTSHNQNIVYGGSTYSANLPFETGTIDSGANLAVDNTALSIFCDGTTFILADFENKLFDNARVTIFWLDTTTPSLGRVIGRTGWFGSIEYDQNNKVMVTVLGLMKLLDFEVTRVYQPACDADLGDNRCKVALNQEKVYFPGNTYYLGDWVYAFDDSLLTAGALTNPSFESDGVVSAGSSITGWTPVGTHFMGVRAISGGALGSDDATYHLYGGADGGANDNGYVSALYQDYDISGWGTTDIDAGKLTYCLFYSVAAFDNTKSGVKISIDFIDATGAVIFTKDKGYTFFDVVDVYTRKAIVEPILEGTRTVRVHLKMIKGEDTEARVAIDNLEQYYYDHTTTSPHSGLVHTLGGFSTSDPSSDIKSPYKYFLNPGFEDDGAISAQVDPAITDWTVDAGGWGEVAASPGGLTSEETYSFAHVDDGGGVQHSTTIRQTLTGIASYLGLNAQALADGNHYLVLHTAYGFKSVNGSSMTISYRFKDSGGTVITSNPNTPYTSATLATNISTFPLMSYHKIALSIPVDSDQLEIIVVMTSPAGSAVGTAVLDRTFIEVGFFGNYPQGQTLLGISGLSPSIVASGADFSTTVGGITVDDSLNWLAHSHKFEYDTVATVVDKKEFTASTLAGSDTTFRLGKLRWLSGDNAGQTSVVRLWTSSTQAIKLYYPTANAIQVGDRFQIFEGCQKRFLEDCRTRFGNAINFRGFPHVPGRLVGEEEL